MTAQIITFFCAFAALAVGSFTCVVISRLPLQLDEPDRFGDVWTSRSWREVFGGSSHCSDCDEPIRWYDNIPVASWVALRGRCRSCGAKIPLYHPLVELGTAAAFVLAVWALGYTWLLLPVLWFIPVAIAIAVIDIRILIVPTKIVWPATAVLVALGIVAAALTDDWGRLLASPFALATLAGPLFLLWFAIPKGMGFGDVRLAVMVGLLAGFYSGDSLGLAALMGILTLFGASVIGVVYGIVGMVARGRKARIPFGPALVTAGFIGALLSEQILDPWL